MFKIFHCNVQVLLSKEQQTWKKFLFVIKVLGRQQPINDTCTRLKLIFPTHDVYEVMGAIPPIHCGGVFPFIIHCVSEENVKVIKNDLFLWDSTVQPVYLNILVCQDINTVINSTDILQLNVAKLMPRSEKTNTEEGMRKIIMFAAHTS